MLGLTSLLVRPRGCCPPSAGTSLGTTKGCGHGEPAAAGRSQVFEAYLGFPKPLIAAVNGPAVGMGVTTASLTDMVVASPSASFHTPFAALGLPAEGCSSYNFPRLLGQANAEVRRGWASESRGGSV